MRWASEEGEFGAQALACSWRNSNLKVELQTQVERSKTMDNEVGLSVVRRALILIFLLAVTAHAQNPPKPQDDEDVVKVKSNLVTIDVIVKDKKGKYISDLKAEDFTISENGITQKVEFFDAPLSRPDAVAASPEPAAAPRNYVSLVLDSQTTDI